MICDVIRMSSTKKGKWRAMSSKPHLSLEAMSCFPLSGMWSHNGLCCLTHTRPISPLSSSQLHSHSQKTHAYKKDYPASILSPAQIRSFLPLHSQTHQAILLPQTTLSPTTSGLTLPTNPVSQYPSLPFVLAAMTINFLNRA